MLKTMLCVALLICVLRLQGLCMPYSADAYSTAFRQTLTHPSAAYPSQDFAENITSLKIPLSTRLKIVHYWRKELQSEYWPNERKLEPGGHDA